MEGCTDILALLVSPYHMYVRTLTALLLSSLNDLQFSLGFYTPF